MNLLDELIEEKRIAYKKAYQEYLDLVKIKSEVNMIPSVIHAYAASAKQTNKKSIPKQTSPIFETVEEARQSLIKEKGNHEYSIKEHPIYFTKFVATWVENNELYCMDYQKKITGYE